MRERSEERTKQFQDTISLLLEMWPRLASWIWEEGHTDADIEDFHIEFGMRQKSQEETNYSQYREYAHTGELHITLTMAGQEFRRTFTRSELEGKL